MRIRSVAKVLWIGAAVLAVGGMALAESLPPKAPTLAPGPSVRYLAIRPGANLGGGPSLPPGMTVRPFPPVSDTGNQVLGTSSATDPGAVRPVGGVKGGSGGVAVGASTPRERLERSLGTIARELR